ncbi:hypothetical protein LTR86_007516 [Recurvomyces mirabilis]|nr:hypothetical protein LTR86_007516 [Recurvomyces mirabilis]
MANYITTHDSKGNSVFSEKVPTAHNALPIPNGELNLLYSTHASLPSVGSEDDIDKYAQDRTNGIATGLCPPNGTAIAMVSFAANSSSPMHRTLTLDYMIILEGVMELRLDSGEVRTLKAGDSVVQRAVMHEWKNVTPNDGIAKAVAIAMDIEKPLEIAGKSLETEFRM